MSDQIQDIAMVEPSTVPLYLSDSTKIKLNYMLTMYDRAKQPSSLSDPTLTISDQIMIDSCKEMHRAASKWSEISSQDENTKEN